MRYFIPAQVGTGTVDAQASLYTDEDTEGHEFGNVAVVSGLQITLVWPSGAHQTNLHEQDEKNSFFKVTGINRFNKSIRQ